MTQMMEHLSTAASRATTILKTATTVKSFDRKVGMLLGTAGWYAAVAA
jgi:hypothetical protein